MLVDVVYSRFGGVWGVCEKCPGNEEYDDASGWFKEEI